MKKKAVGIQKDEQVVIDYGQRTDFPLLAEGEHDAVIHSMRPENGPLGTYLRTRFSIENDELNRQAWMNISLADGALWRIKAMARSLKLVAEARTYANRAEFEADVVQMFTGQPVRISIENEKFQGVVRNRVVSVTARS